MARKYEENKILNLFLKHPSINILNHELKKNVDI